MTKVGIFPGHELPMCPACEQWEKVRTLAEKQACETIWKAVDTL